MDVNSVANSIKQLVIGSGKFIQEAHTFEQAEERIIHLEENDDQFHKYELVKTLKSEIEDKLGAFVDEEIEKCSEAGHEYISDQDTLVARVTEHILKSHQFDKLKNSILRYVQEAVDRLVENFEDEFRGIHKDEETPGNSKERDPYAFSDEESTLSGSYNQDGFMFVTHEQLRKNIEHLDKKNNLQTRREALNGLIHMSLNEVLTNDESYQREWAFMERGIIDALGEQDDHILPKAALKFISRGFSSTHGNSRELYCTLTTFLYEYVSNKKYSVPKVKNGLDTKRPDIINLLAAFRLLNDFQRHIPNYWVRYPTRFLDEVLENTLKLISFHGQMGVMAATSQNMTPIHFMALIDPMAEWFVNWTHGCYSRVPLFNQLSKHKSFLEGLIRSVLEFVASCKVPFDLVSEISDNTSSWRGSTVPQQQRTSYSGEELEYLYFVHAINIVGRLLTYRQITRLFPVKVRGYDEEITITKLICAICQMTTSPVGPGTVPRSKTAVYDPSLLSAEVLKKLCSTESAYSRCLCKDEVTSTLLMPITNWLDGGAMEGSCVSETTYLNIADILSMMASRSEGRRHLLYGEHGDRFVKTRSSAAHTLTEFTKKALAGTLPNVQASKPVAGAYLFLCRQFYNNGEGLQALYSYDLHSVVGEAWKQASKSAKNLKVGAIDRNQVERSGWDDVLCDNLLNLASTPKGVLLMEQSGAMRDCISYLFKRHQQRLQVSKLEKFGYGTIITQIAATSCGVLLLEKEGLIQALCLDAWNSIEPGEEFEVPFQPKIWPIDEVDKLAHKPLVNLLHVLSSFSSVFEILGGEKLAAKTEFTFRDKPASLTDLLNRVVLINTKVDDDKMHFLFNFSQSHVFGLRLLSAMISCLDTLLLMETQFKVLDILLASQTAEDISSGGQLVLDQLTLERNHILVRGHLVGGPSERILPPRSLPSNYNSLFPYPLVQGVAIPKEYSPSASAQSSIKQESELSKFLAETKNVEPDFAWLEKCRKSFCSTLTSKPDLAKGSVLQDMLENIVKFKSSSLEEAIFTAAPTDTENGLKSFKLTALQELGLKKAVQYGVQLKILTSAQDAQENLSKLLRQCGFFMKQQQRQVVSNMRSLSHHYSGFDWFVATIFLIMRGSRDRCWKYLEKFSSLSVSGYVWAARLHRSVHLPAHLASSGISPILYSACHSVELLLQVELPLVYSAFRMSGFTASQTCQLWIRQCFWNFLDWQEICHYIAVCTVLGCDYQVYMCVAIFKHLEQEILYHQQQQDLVLLLREQPITGFQVGRNLEYMQQLEVKFRKTVLPDMLNFSKP